MLGFKLRNYTESQQGITYIEIMAVVTILGIIATVAMPNLSLNNHRKLDMATAEVVEAIRFAQTESMRTGSSYGVEFSSTNDTVKVFRLDYSEFWGVPIWTSTFNVYHPVDKKLYSLNIKTDSATAGVDLQSYSIHFGNFGMNSNGLEFNSSGNPKSSFLSRDYMLNGTATIALSYLGQTRVINVVPMTGRVTVQ